MRSVAVCIICVSLAATSFTQETVRAIPSFDKLDGISLGVPVTWNGRFFSDGSAELINGASLSASVPVGSFSFEEVYNLLLPHLKQDEDAESMYVILDEKEEDTELPVFFLSDKDIMRKIMHGLCDKLLSSPDVFFGMFGEEIFKGNLRKEPLVPGDPPYLKSEEEEEEGEGVRSKEEVVRRKEEVGGDRGEVKGDEAEEEMPVAAKKAGKPSLLFYVGIGVLACVGAVLFLLTTLR